MGNNSLGLGSTHFMRIHRLAPLVALFSLSTGAALAQQIPQSNPDVIPAPDLPGNGVLLYPGGEYGRITRPLLQPGEPYPGSHPAKIHLHMPVKHVAKKEAPAPVAVSVDSSPPPAAVTASAPAVAEVSPVAPMQTPAVVKHPPAVKHAVQTASAPAPAAASPLDTNLGASSVPFTFGPASPPPAPPPSRVAKANPAPTETLTTETAAPNAPGQGLSKQTQIIFAAGAPDPSPDSIDAIKGLAGPLNSALVGGASRIQIVAYGGQRGDKSSDARRLSLKRARIVRQLLIDGGVPAERIDVRAMGGATDAAPADRVDIFTKA